ncbi:MAG: uL15m family ribosomal protein, partial [candidate division WOR-3 bacterium]
GEINKPIILKVHAISSSAKEKIEKAGGKVEIIEEK